MQAVQLKKGRKYYFSLSINADERAGGPRWFYCPAGGENVVMWYGSTYGKWQKVVIPEFPAATW
tara:strand:- start:1731 stop:1922 length:192 start_codon:yes stop_codon:yes gene_type:complete